MRSSKNRSRSKNNRNRSVGNIVNRVFDSSGPEGKVRGTPQQIIDKYGQLTRDAQLSNDRVAAENFQQHAEHYIRMLAEAQKEMEARREQQEQQQRERNQQQQQRREEQARDENDAPQPAAEGAGEQPDIIETPEERGSALVETPEGKAKPKSQSRSKKPAPEHGDASGGGEAADKGSSPAAAE